MQILRLASFALLCPQFSAPAAQASTEPADSVVFRGVCREQWRREHPYPASKRSANLNVGEPRTVRVIYFLPNDRPFRQEVVDSMRSVIRQVQFFYSEQMHAHGYGDKAFRIETGAQGEPLVHRVDGRHAEGEYERALSLVEEVGQSFDLDANIYFIGAAINYHAGFGVRQGKYGGFVFVEDEHIRFGLAAHELGHAFGLRHDFSDGAFLMSYGPGRYRLSACHARFLAVHTYFNSKVPIGEGRPPVLDLLSPVGYPAESQSVAVSLNISASAGLHQVQLWVDGPQGLEVKACRSMVGGKDGEVEFQYDGVIPSTARDDHYSHVLYRTSLSDPPRHPITVTALDADGNLGSVTFVLEELSPYRIGTLEAHTDRVNSVTFSPDGGSLASGSWDATIRLWDGETRKVIATLENIGRGSRVTFLRDSTMLAIAYGRSVKLWDVKTGEVVAILEGLDGFPFVASLRDGAVLAITSGRSVELWDVASGEITTVLEGLSAQVQSVSFAKEGTVLAIASGKLVQLWDVTSRENTATLDAHSGWVHSVSLSPDGRLLASGASDGRALLWEVGKPNPIATVGKSQRDITSVVFSPDGFLLAVATLESGKGTGSTVRLWDVVTPEPLAVFGHPEEVWSMAFSSDGATLATAGSDDGTITLWDVSELAGSGPFGPNPDFDGDGTVGFSDFVQFAGKFGLSQGDKGFDARFDLDGNGAVGFSDFLIFAGAFGKA